MVSVWSCRNFSWLQNELAHTWTVLCTLNSGTSSGSQFKVYSFVWQCFVCQCNEYSIISPDFSLRCDFIKWLLLFRMANAIASIELHKHPFSQLSRVFIRYGWWLLRLLAVPSLSCHKPSIRMLFLDSSFIYSLCLYSAYKRVNSASMHGLSQHSAAKAQRAYTSLA